MPKGKGYSNGRITVKRKPKVKVTLKPPVKVKVKPKVRVILKTTGSTKKKFKVKRRA